MTDKGLTISRMAVASARSVGLLDFEVILEYELHVRKEDNYEGYKKRCASRAYGRIYA